MSYLNQIHKEFLEDIKENQWKLIRTWNPNYESVSPRLFFTSIFKDTLEQDHRRSFVVNRDFSNQYTCNDLETFLEKQEKFTYFTPQTHWHYRSRTKETLSRLNCFVLDFDLAKDGTDRDYNFWELCDVIYYEIGLEPHFIYPTKTDGNFNVVFLFKSVPASPNRVLLYESILKRLSILLGSDFSATDASHVFSIPKDGIFQFKSNLDQYDLDDFKIILEYEDINDRLQEFRNEYLTSDVVSLTEHQIMKLKSVEKLLNCEIDDRRNHACFTLALLFYSLGKNQADVEKFFYEYWYKLANDERFDTRFPLREIRDSIKSAFSGKYAGPSREWIENLTDEPFPINIYRSSYVKKSVDERVYMSKNTIRSRLIEWIRDNPKEQIKQTELASTLDVSYRSLKLQIKQLKDEGILEAKTTRGRNATTTFILQENKFIAEASVKDTFEFEHHLTENHA